MQKRNWRIWLVLGIVVFLLIGATVMLLYKNCCNDTKAAQDNAGTEKSFTLDSEYARCYLEATSNYEKCEVNKQFSEKWKQEAEHYIKEICEIADEELNQALISAQEAWENTYQLHVDENLAYLLYVYGSGTIVPVLHSEYEYALQRERAIELYEMYNGVKGVYEIKEQYPNPPTNPNP